MVDDAKNGDVLFAHKVFDRFVERHKQAYETQVDLLKQTPDFHVDESIADDSKTYDYPVDEKEFRDRWRKRVKLDLLREKVDQVDPKEGSTSSCAATASGTRFGVRWTRPTCSNSI